MIDVHRWASPGVKFRIQHLGLDGAPPGGRCPIGATIEGFTGSTKSHLQFKVLLSINSVGPCWVQ